MRRALAFVGTVMSCLAPVAPAGQGPGTDPAQSEPSSEPPQDDPPPQGGSDAKQDAELPEILVIGRKSDEGVPIVPLNSIGSRNVFGPEQVRETGARDINDLVLHLPAISTRPYNGGEAAAPNLSMRGLPDDGLTEYINILIDGVPSSPLPYGWTAFSFFPLTPDRIYAMDYLRGAHSVRYSPNTVGGVLNFITQPIPDDGTLEIRSTFGTFDYSSTLLSGGDRAGNFGWHVAYVDRRGDGYRDAGEFSQNDINLKMRQDMSDKDWWALSLSYMDDEHKAPGGLTLEQYEQNPFGNARPENRFKGYRGVTDFVYHCDIGSDTWVEAFTYGSLTNRQLDAQRPQFPAPGDALTLSQWYDDSYFFGLGSRVEHRFGDQNTLYGGVRYQREWIPDWSIDSGPYPSGAPSVELQANQYTLETFSLHVDDTYRPTEKLAITFGARLEAVPTAEGENDVGAGEFTFDESFTGVLPGVGASYLITEDWSVFANYFEGFRAPQVWGFGLAPDPSQADLVFEEADSWEAGTRYAGPSGISASATFWQNDYDDFFTFYSGFYENLGKITAEGVDLEAVWEAGESIPSMEGFSVLGSMTFQDSTIGSGPAEGNQVPYAWKEKAAWRFRYEFGEGWLATLGGTYVGESFSDEDNTTVENPEGTLGVNPARTLWDAQVAKVWELGESGRLRLSVGATNLFDEDWFVHSRGGFFGGGKVAGQPQQTYVGLG